MNKAVTQRHSKDEKIIKKHSKDIYLRAMENMQVKSLWIKIMINANSNRVWVCISMAISWWSVAWVGAILKSSEKPTAAGLTGLWRHWRLWSLGWFKLKTLQYTPLTSGQQDESLHFIYLMLENKLWACAESRSLSLCTMVSLIIAWWFAWNQYSSCG